jgi:5'-nucleotidase
MTRPLIRSSAVLVVALALSGCSGSPWSLKSLDFWSAPEPPARLTDAEFRDAAETRVSWQSSGFSAATAEDQLVRGKLLGLNDFHGALNGETRNGRTRGGASVLAAYLKAEAEEVSGRAIIVHAGDMVGASPPVSGLIQDEPAIEFLNLLANEACSQQDLMAPDCNMVGTLGNHEFDEGPAEILRLLGGGTHSEVAASADDWAGVNIPYVSANVIDVATGKTFLPPYVIKEIGGVKVAFIGAVLRGTPSIVSPWGVTGLRFKDEAEAINSYVPEIRAKGAEAIVVNIHQGLRQTTLGKMAVVGEGDLVGSIIDIVQALDPAVDIVVSGHAHSFTNVLVPLPGGHEILLTQAFSGGSAYGDIDITLDRASGDIVEKSASIVTTWADQGPGLSLDPVIAEFLAMANEEVAPLVNRKISTSEVLLIPFANDAGESALGNLVADAQRASMKADMGFISMGGLRAPIEPGDILWGTLAKVHPFGNEVMAVTLTGEQIGRLLQQQWSNPDRARILQVSGLRFKWDENLPVETRVSGLTDESGTPIDPATEYRVAVANFYVTGGDGFTVFDEGTNKVVGPTDLDALVDYIEGLGHPVSVGIEERVQKIN